MPFVSAVSSRCETVEKNILQVRILDMSGGQKTKSFGAKTRLKYTGGLQINPHDDEGSVSVRIYERCSCALAPYADEM